MFGAPEDTFATERELAGIRETQGELLTAPGRAAPVPEGQAALPTEAARAPQPPRGLERELAQIAEERTLAQEALADPRTRRMKGETVRLRTQIESLTEQERTIQNFQARGLTPEQMADELAEMQVEIEQRAARTVPSGRDFSPAFGTAERAEFELARRGRRPPSQRERVFRPTEAESEAAGELPARLGLEPQVNERAYARAFEGDVPPVGGGAQIPIHDLPAPGPVGERGFSAAEEAVGIKQQTLLRPGRVTQLPIVKPVLSVFFPSVSLDRKVLAGYNARGAVQSTLETGFGSARRPVLQEVVEAWDEVPAAYRGPRDNPFKNTIKDFADNPEFYDPPSPRLTAAVQAYDQVSVQILKQAREQYGVDVLPFSSGKPGSFYLPSTPTRESIDDALQKVADTYTSASVTGRAGVAKQRLYEGAYQRWKKNPKFQAETDIETLTGMHDTALARMAGNETFRVGAGGKTRLDVMQETHPKLYEAMTGLRNRLAALRSNARNLDQRLSDRVDAFLSDPDSVPLVELSESLDVRLAKGR